MTNILLKSSRLGLVSMTLAFSTAAIAYESGSTGSDGAFSPQVDTVVPLSADGVFNYTTINIPNGVTVTYERNATNTPVVILASGNVTIAGTLDVSGDAGADVGAQGDGNLGDDGLPGVGGPGGFDGGAGGTLTGLLGGNGLGPGGGSGAIRLFTTGRGCSGGAGGYTDRGGRSTDCASSGDPSSAPIYGSVEIQPLIGGSGGGGGYSGASFVGGGGGGGGGAILISSSGTISVTGNLLARGGDGGIPNGASSGGQGGGGSGGAIRLIATTIDGNGVISAAGGTTIRQPLFTRPQGFDASVGRVRLEAENLTRTAATIPAAIVSGPQEQFLANIPAIRILRVAGIDVPANPTGSSDVVIPEATTNPVQVEFATTNIPVGNTVELTLTPQFGSSAEAISGAITGTDESGTAGVNIDIPDGPSTLSAQVTFTISVVSLQEDYSKFAQGELVDKVRVHFDQTRGSLTTFIAVSGKEYTWPSNAVLLN